MMCNRKSKMWNSNLFQLFATKNSAGFEAIQVVFQSCSASKWPQKFIVFLKFSKDAVDILLGSNGCHFYRYLIRCSEHESLLPLPSHSTLNGGHFYRFPCTVL